MRGLKWIEVKCPGKEDTRRTPRGVRGLKLKASEEGIVGYIRRTPRGVRGLK